MSEQTKMTDRANSVTSDLNFLIGNQWLPKLLERADASKVEFFKNKLIDTQNGIGWCIDERKPLHPEDNNSKPAFVGGAAGWAVLFIATGIANTPEEAVGLTQQLYNQMGWNEMEAHIDDEHGKITDLCQLQSRNKGCGFLSVWFEVTRILRFVLQDEMSFLRIPKFHEGSEFIDAIAKNPQGKIVPLTGSHQAETAAFVINQIPGKTLDRSSLYADNPAFLWDAAATTNAQVLEKFNSLAKTNMNQNQFFKLQTIMHLATGLMLGVLRLDGANKNLVILE